MIKCQDICMKLNIPIKIGTGYISTNFHVNAASRSDLLSIFVTHILRDVKKKVISKKVISTATTSIYLRLHHIWILKFAFLYNQKCLLSPPCRWHFWLSSKGTIPLFHNCVWPHHRHHACPIKTIKFE